MSSKTRRGLAFVLKDGAWANSQPGTPQGLVVSAIQAQKNHRNVMNIHYGSAEYRRDNVLVVWASPPCIERLCGQVRANTLDDASMTVVTLDRRAYSGVQLTDFDKAQARALAGTHRVKQLPAKRMGAAATTEPEPPAQPNTSTETPAPPAIEPSPATEPGTPPPSTEPEPPPAERPAASATENSGDQAGDIAGRAEVRDLAEPVAAGAN